jgi:hypothetical protein
MMSLISGIILDGTSVDFEELASIRVFKTHKGFVETEVRTPGRDQILSFGVHGAE